MFALKEKVVAKKKEPEEPCIVNDPSTNAPVFKPSQIIKTCADYCQNLLKRDEPKEDFVMDLEWKRRVHDVRMKEVLDDDLKLTKDMFNEALKLVKKKGGHKYDFILKAGNSLLEALFKLYQTVWNSEKKPDSWRDTTVIQLYKGRGLKEDLNNKRHLHTKKEVPKLFQHLVTNAMKPNIINNMSPYQIGAIPGHRSEEHLFTIKSYLALAEKNNVAVIVNLLDLVKFFDKEDLLDVLDELYKANVRGKVYKLVYELNKDNRITVRTAFGDSDKREIKESLSQGSIDGAILSSNNLSKGVDDYFSSSECEVSYIDVPLLPQIYQDDLSRLSLDLLSTQLGLNRFENLANSKLLSFNVLKSCVVVMGKKKERKALEEKIEDNPLKLYDKPINLKSQGTYLGDEIGSIVSDSVTLTINKRIGIVKKAIFEIKFIVEDCRSKVAGAINTGILIWESCLIPFLLNNSSTWLETKKSDIDRLVKLQNLFLCTLLGVQHCPAVMMEEI